ncbi:CDP-alcohol phosphatidyltransferase family protein [Neobacillus sp. 179-J 1A1 HS]|uniref:CDP-alcohol phosphatidyltransferase family protein n=1 Tax=Neobacillus driksii TaxID=3035913 RepID=UPI0035BC2332
MIGLLNLSSFVPREVDESNANCLSFSRIIFSLFLLFVQPFSSSFYAIYIFCGFSDIMDGFIARRTGKTSSLGERLDSMADMVMTVVLFVLLYPIVNRKS